MSGILSTIPNWNLSSSGFDLLSSSTSHSYYNFDKREWDVLTKLKKKVSKSGGRIYQSFTIYRYFDSGSTKSYSSDYENIESFADNRVICPKGKYHPLSYHNSYIFPYYYLNIHKPTNFIENGNWELECFRHVTGYFLVFYLMNDDNSLFSDYIKNHKNIINNKKSDFSDQIYDFKLENGTEAKSPDNEGYKKYNMLTIIMENNYIKLKCVDVRFSMNSNYDILISDSSIVPNELNLTIAKANNKAIFRNMSDEFYFITYNNVSDFISGYSTMSTSDYSNIKDVTFEINEQSPFEFVGEVEII